MTPGDRRHWKTDDFRTTLDDGRHPEDPGRRTTPGRHWTSDDTRKTLEDGRLPDDSRRHWTTNDTRKTLEDGRHRTTDDLRTILEDGRHPEDTGQRSRLGWPKFKRIKSQDYEIYLDYLCICRGISYLPRLANRVIETIVAQLIATAAASLNN